MRRKLLEQYLNARRTHVAELPEAQTLHAQLREECWDLYSQIPADEVAHITHRAAAFVELVRDVNVPVGDIRQVVSKANPLDLVRMLDVLRSYRINSRRARQTGLRVLLNHKDFAHIAATKRQRTIRLLQHLLGERTWSSVRRTVVSVHKGDDKPSGDSQRFLQRQILRFTNRPDVVMEVLQFLAGLGLPSKDKHEDQKKAWLVIPWLGKHAEASGLVFNPKEESIRQSVAARRELNAGRGLPLDTLFGLRGTYASKVDSKHVRSLAAKTQVEANNPMTDMIKAAMSAEMLLKRYVEPVQTAAASVSGHVAVLLDMSASMASSGERLNHPAALGQAIVRRIHEVIERVDVIRVGGRDADGFALPIGAADIAMGLIDAVETKADAIFIVSDGFENTRQGDVSAVIDGLRTLGATTPVVQVIPLFKSTEDISRRVFGPNVPHVAISNERETGELIARSQLAAMSDSVSDREMQLFCQLAISA